MSLLAIMSAVIGCDRQVEKSDRKPVSFTLNPYLRTIETRSEGINPRTQDRTELVFTSQSSSGGRGEWPLAAVVATKDRLDDPQINVRVYDEDAGAVRVAVRFTGPKVVTLATIVFPHVSRADQFMLKTVPGDSPYRGYRIKGENLEITWPEIGYGLVSFRAWPHVH